MEKKQQSKVNLFKGKKIEKEQTKGSKNKNKIKIDPWYYNLLFYLNLTIMGHQSGIIC